MTTHKPLKVFCSYSHRDEHYLEVLKTWLVGLEREGLIEEWHDSMISPGQEWQEAIAKSLETSQMILLLVTPDFMASQYIYEEEIDRAIERHERGEARIIPIIVRPAPWEGTALDRLQALPKNARAITTWSNRDEAWLNVLQGIQRAVEELLFEPEDQEPIKASEQLYREAVERVRADGTLQRREVERLDDLANEYELGTISTSAIEEEIMGDTKEAILERQEREAREKERQEQYRRAVEEAYSDHELNEANAQQLSTLARDLGLSTEATADIELAVLGDTIRAILRQQARKLDERQLYLAGLYDLARSLYQKQEWQAVIEAFGQIRSKEPTYPDPEELFKSASDALELRQRVTAVYERGQRYMDAGEWQQALECFDEVQRLEPGYQETEELLSQVRQELTPPPRVEVPDLIGQDILQVSSTLDSRDLEIGSQRETPTDTVPEGQIIEQSPEAGRDVQAGTLVNVTVSSGPAPVDVPNLVGRYHSEARSMLEAAGLKLDVMTLAPSDDMPEDRVVRQFPESGEKVTLGSSVHVILSSGPREVFKQSQPRPSIIEGLVRICAKFAGSSYYLEEAIPEEKLTNARSSFPIPTTERVVALLDATRDGSGRYGLAICEEGIRWCNERTSSGGLIYRHWRSTQRGSLLWSEVDNTQHIEKHAGYNVVPIRIGENGLFFMPRFAMDPDDLVQLLSDLQSYLRGYAHLEVKPSEDAKGQVEALGVELSQTRSSDTDRQITAEDEASVVNHREPGSTEISATGTPADRIQLSLPTNVITASNADQIKPLNTLRHTYSVSAVEFAPDGKLLASGSAHAAVGLWRVKDSELLHGLVWHQGPVNTVAFSPDGKLLASGSRDSTVGLWRVEDTELLHGLMGHDVGFSVNTVAFSPDGKLLASGSDDRTVRLWRVEDGSQLGVLEGHKNRVNAVAFSTNSKLLASGSDGRTRNDDTVRLWRVEDGEPLHTMEGQLGFVDTVAFSADGKLLASVFLDGTVRIWRVDDEELVRELRLPQARALQSLAFSPDGKLLASGSRDKRIRLWRVEDGSQLGVLEGHTKKVTSVAFSADGKLLASGSDDRTVRLWGVASLPD